MPRLFQSRKILLLAATSMSISSTAIAQEDPETTEVEEIIVTGSRISGTAAGLTAQPVQVISQTTLEALGATQVADVLDRIPALQNSTSSAQAFGGPATLDLRGLGANRTLTLVNGRRYVGGVAGTASVDISTIPSALVDQVEILTGGASAVYGSDAVTGVVNFILKEDFDGVETTVQTGLSERGDSLDQFVSMLYGKNYDGGRGNITVGIQMNQSNGILYGDREFSRDNGIADDYTNPDLFFQEGDPIPTGRTLANTRGRTILLNGQPRYANTDQSLVDRATNASARSFIDDPVFSISSVGGLIGIDLDGDGYADPAGAYSSSSVNEQCRQSRNGQQGYGCWVIDPDTGEFRTFDDGLYAGSSNQSGGDGAPQTFNGQSLIPDEQSLNFSLTGNYEVSAQFKPFYEVQIGLNESVSYNPYQTFDDSIPISLDNPFIPDDLRALVNAEIAADPSTASTAKIVISRDHIDVFDPRSEEERETYRAVIGARGELDLGWNYEISANYGRTERAVTQAVRLEDRFFAAIDAVIDPATGEAVCRSTLDPTAEPQISGLYNEFPGTVPNAFQTFTPGAGSECRPLNLFGVGNVDPAASAFVGPQATDRTVIDQTVFGLFLTGDLDNWFTLPGGSIGFAVGGEYRRENSDFNPNDYDEQGLTFQYASTAAVKGGFDVAEVFAELNLPILSETPFAETLSLSVAARLGDYSTVGNTETYKVDLIWAPVRDLRFRGGFARAVRAPNIDELYSPLESATFRPIDPCSAENIDQGSEFRENNCRQALAAVGVNVGGIYDFEDPLTARFLGAAGGNPDLQAETSESYTIGTVIRPRWTPDLTLTVDYWKIEIEDAIASVSAQDIVNSCYDAPSLDNQYCALIERNDTAGSQTQGGFSYLEQTLLNYAGLDASGVDFAVNYQLGLDQLGFTEMGDLALSISGTWLETRNNYLFVDDPDRPNPEKGELNYPEWAFNTQVRWSKGPFSAGLYSNYQSKQTRGAVEIENVDSFDVPYNDPIWTHDASIQWDFQEGRRVTFGVNNLTDEEPFESSTTNPVSGVGRYYFLRLNGSF